MIAKPVVRWTRDDYYRMADAGIFRDRRVELIEGEVVAMTPQRNAHFVAIKLLHDELARVFDQDHWVRVQGPLTLSNDSEPEPDIAVVRGHARDFSDHPTSALLVVEVSESSLNLDRNVKAALYAKAGIPDYWILNLSDRQLEVFRHPASDRQSPARYTELRTLGPNESIAPLAAPEGAVKVADLLP